MNRATKFHSLRLLQISLSAFVVEDKRNIKSFKCRQFEHYAKEYEIKKKNRGDLKRNMNKSFYC